MNWKGLFDVTDWVGDNPAADDIVISQSLIESLTLCPARVGQRDEDYYIEVPGKAATWGTAMHELAERRLNGEDDTTLMLEDVIRDAWERAVSHNRGKETGFSLYDLEDPYAITQQVEELRYAFTLWNKRYEMEYSDLNIIGIESSKTRLLGVLPDGRGIWVNGTADVVTPHMILDWKTANRPWTSGKAEVRAQGPLYVWLHEEELVGLPTEVRYDIYDRKNGVWQEFSTEVTAGCIDAALRTAWQWGTQMAHNIYPYTPAGESYGKPQRAWYCSAKWCPAWSGCQGKALVQDSRDLSEPRVVTW